MRHMNAVCAIWLACACLCTQSTAGTISVSDTGASSLTTCTLAQAIYASNLANNPTDATPPGATTVNPLSDSATTTIGVGACTGATSGANTISLPATAAISFSSDSPDNYWYGPNALPPIASTITIEGNGATLSVTVGTSPRLRFFFVGADPSAAGPTPGYNTPGAGKLTLHNLSLTGGRQNGGNAHSAGNGGYSGGGAGMGGAIFNQGTLSLGAVTLNDNRAMGGDGGNMGTVAGIAGSGGMGADGWFNSAGPGEAISGGMGGRVPGGSGEPGGSGNVSSHGGAGGGPASGLAGAGGAMGLGGAAGDGGGGGGAFLGSTYGGYNGNGSNTGGAGGGGFGGWGPYSNYFGNGGDGIGNIGCTCPGELGADAAGVGGGGGDGGGGNGGGGGGFGGGGGNAGGGGGFGGGGGAGNSVVAGGSGGFGGGGAAANFGGGGGGAGLGGAIFNHFGTVTLLNSTLTGNTATGGASGGIGASTGSGFGGAIFNLNGTLTVSFSTLAANSADDGGAIYSLAYNAVASTATPSAGSSNASVMLANNILADSVGAHDLVVDQPELVSGGLTNAATAAASKSGINLVMTSANLNNASALPMFEVTLDPQLESLSANGGLDVPSTMALAPSSFASTLATCYDAQGQPVDVDERGYPRPLKNCDLGAYNGNDRIFYSVFDFLGPNYSH